MAFNATVRDRHLEEMRYQSSQAFDDRPFPATYAPLASNAGLHGRSAMPDPRVGLTRRFTTESMMAPQVGSVWDSSRIPRHDNTDMGQLSDFEVATMTSNPDLDGRS